MRRPALLVAWAAVWFSALGGIVALPGPCRAVEADSGLRVATFRCDVSPPLGGHPLIWLTPAKSIEDPLWAKGIVLEDHGQRIT